MKFPQKAYSSAYPHLWRQLTVLAIVPALLVDPSAALAFAPPQFPSIKPGISGLWIAEALSPADYGALEDILHQNVRSPQIPVRTRVQRLLPSAGAQARSAISFVSRRRLPRGLRVAAFAGLTSAITQAAQFARNSAGQAYAQFEAGDGTGKILEPIHKAIKETLSPVESGKFIFNGPIWGDHGAAARLAAQLKEHVIGLNPHRPSGVPRTGDRIFLNDMGVPDAIQAKLAPLSPEPIRSPLSPATADHWVAGPSHAGTDWIHWVGIHSWEILFVTAVASLAGYLIYRHFKKQGQNISVAGPSGILGGLVAGGLAALVAFSPLPFFSQGIIPLVTLTALVALTMNTFAPGLRGRELRQGSVGRDPQGNSGSITRNLIGSLSDHVRSMQRVAASIRAAGQQKRRRIKPWILERGDAISVVPLSVALFGGSLFVAIRWGSSSLAYNAAGAAALLWGSVVLIQSELAKRGWIPPPTKSQDWEFITRNLAVLSLPLWFIASMGAGLLGARYDAPSKLADIFQTMWDHAAGDGLVVVGVLASVHLIWKSMAATDAPGARNSVREKLLRTLGSLPKISFSRPRALPAAVLFKPPAPNSTATPFPGDSRRAAAQKEPQEFRLWTYVLLFSGAIFGASVFAAVVLGSSALAYEAAAAAILLWTPAVLMQRRNAGRVKIRPGDWKGQERKERSQMIALLSLPLWFIATMSAGLTGIHFGVPSILAAILLSVKGHPGADALVVLGALASVLASGRLLKAWDIDGPDAMGIKTAGGIVGGLAVALLVFSAQGKGKMLWPTLLGLTAMVALLHIGWSFFAAPDARSAKRSVRKRISRIRRLSWTSIRAAAARVTTFLTLIVLFMGGLFMNGDRGHGSPSRVYHPVSTAA